jgi:hypothetical protein
LVGAQTHACIYIFRGGHSFHESEEGFVDHGHQDAVDDEAGPVQGDAGGLAGMLCQQLSCLLFDVGEGFSSLHFSVFQQCKQVRNGAAGHISNPEKEEGFKKKRSPLTSSTSAIKGTGFIQWIPICAIVNKLVST